MAAKYILDGYVSFGENQRMAQRKRAVTDAELKRVMSLLGQRGGAARAKALTPEQRRRFARAAVLARWAKRRKGRKG